METTNTNLNITNKENTNESTTFTSNHSSSTTTNNNPLSIELFKCKDCKKFPEDPRESICCGHLFCLKCSTNLQECAFCNKYCEFRENTFAKMLLNTMEIKCEFNCGKVLKIKDLKNHYSNCPKKIFKCTIEFCVFEGFYSDFCDHIIKIHPEFVLILMENFEDFNKEKKRVVIDSFSDEHSSFSSRPPLVRNLTMVAEEESISNERHSGEELRVRRLNQYDFNYFVDMYNEFDDNISDNSDEYMM